MSGHVISTEPEMDDFVGERITDQREVFKPKFMLNARTAVLQAVHDFNGSSLYGWGESFRKGHR
jgi:hypothetical protein